MIESTRFVDTCITFGDLLFFSGLWLGCYSAYQMWKRRKP